MRPPTSTSAPPPSSLCFALIVALLTIGSWAEAQVVVSRIYGGGSFNPAVPYQFDYVELFNRGGAPVSLDGWSLQYADATSGTWTATALPPATIPSGGYFLVQMGRNAGDLEGDPLPTPDHTANINMGHASGKVLVRRDVAAFSVSCPTSLADGTISDLVGYGNANCFEGTGPTGGPGPQNSVSRIGSGCIDTNNNATDFALVGASAAPRNSASPLSGPCNDIGVSVSGTPDPLGAGSRLTYTIRVDNFSFIDSDPVSVTGTLESALVPFSCAIDGGTTTTCNLNGNDFEAAFGSIAAQDFALITLAADLPCTHTPAGDFLFTVTATTAVDQYLNNNVATAVTAVTFDNVGPTFTSCPSAVSLPADANCEAFAPDFLPFVSATDNCSTFTFTQSPDAGTTLTLGLNTITISATDSFANITNCLVTVDVVDVTSPTVTSFATVTVQADASFMAAVPDVTGLVTAFDACSAVGNITITQSPAAGTLVGVGDNFVTVRATDEAGNYAESVGIVTVTPPDGEFWIVASLSTKSPGPR